MAEPDNIVLAHLRELRADMTARFDAIDGRFEAMEKRLDAMHSNGMKALKSFVGHRTMTGDPWPASMTRCSAFASGSMRTSRT